MNTQNLRQQRYRKRQNALGRKTITIQLPVDLIDTLRAGKGAGTLAAHVERVIREGLKTVTNNIKETAENIHGYDWDVAEKQFEDDIEAGKERYVQTLAESGYTYGTIAQKLTFDGYPPPKGKTKWHANTVRAILNRGKLPSI